MKYLIPLLLVALHSNSVCNELTVNQAPHTITMLGSGYVGLVSGTCLADFGHHVICADIDINKINKLRLGNIPIYEPGLDELVRRNVQEGRLVFTYDVEFAIRSSSIIFIAVQTPSEKNGSANLTAFEHVIETIVQNLNFKKTIVVKSTVPIGTCNNLKEILIKKYNISPDMFDIISNPEFLREGKAIEDFFNPDRLVVGASEQSFPLMKDIYQKLISKNVPLILTDVTTAETIKYVSNSFLGMKISFINEIANLCDRIGIDAYAVARGIGLDKRIGPLFLNPGPGFGGSCFPKDIQALLRTAQEYGISLHTVQATLTANSIQHHKPVEKLLKLMNDNVKGKTIALLGLAFKADTDDIREAPAIKTIQSLLDQHALIKAYDPAAMNNMKNLFPDITYCSSLYEAVTDADAAIVMTEWQEFAVMDLAKVRSLMKQPIVVDARHIINPQVFQDAGFISECIGQSYLCRKSEKC